MTLERLLIRSALFSWLDGILAGRHDQEKAFLVYGFWRSGTTLLMERVAELTRSRSFFEPLLLKVPATWPEKYRRLNSPELHRFTIPHELLAHPCTYVSTDTGDSGLDPFLEDMLAGKMSTRWTRKSRHLRNSFSPDMTIKMVRANLLAAYLEQRFGCRSIFIIRHPGAIMASVTRRQRHGSRRDGIETGLMSHEFLDAILSQKSLVADHLGPHMDLIRKWNSDGFNRMVLSWAILNYVPLKQIRDDQFHPLLIRFEEYVLDADMGGKLAKHFGVEGLLSEEDHLSRNSATVQVSRRGVDPITRLFSWKDELSETQIQIIYEICSGFGDILMDQIRAIDALAEVHSEGMR